MTIAFKRALRWILAGYLVLAWGILAWMGSTGISLREDLLRNDASRTLEITQYFVIERLHHILQEAELPAHSRTTGISLAHWSVQPDGTLTPKQIEISPQSILTQEEWHLLERRFPIPKWRPNDNSQGLMWVETRSGDRFLRYWLYEDRQHLREILFPPGLLRIPGHPPFDLFLIDKRGRLISSNRPTFQPGEPLNHLSIVERAQDPLYNDAGQFQTKLSPQDEAREGFYQRISPSGALLVAVLPSPTQVMESALPQLYYLVLAALLLPLVVLVIVWLTLFRKRILRKLSLKLHASVKNTSDMKQASFSEK